MSDDLLDEADGMTGEIEGEAEGASVTDGFVASPNESTAGVDIDESAAMVIEGTVENAEGLTWRLDMNGVFYLVGEGELPSTFLTYKLGDEREWFNDYSITSLVIGSKVSGNLYCFYLGENIYSSLQNIVIKDRANGVNLDIKENGLV